MAYGGGDNYDGTLSGGPIGKEIADAGEVNRNMKLEQYFKGLSDVTRLRMLNLLLHGELCGCDVKFVLGMSQPNVSRHLTYLKNCGLVSDRRDGPRIFYRLAEVKPGTSRSFFDFLPQVFKGEKLLQEDTRKLKEAIQMGLCTRSEWRPYSALPKTNFLRV